jgi:glycosyltransferase involved in cell wall biosynthesis
LTKYFIDLGKGTAFSTKIKMFFSILLGRPLADFSQIFRTEDFPEINLMISPMVSLIPLILDKPYIVTIHDFQHKYLPEMFSLRDRLEREYLYKVAATNARMILCESEFVRNDIRKFLKIPPERIKVIVSPPPDYITSFRSNSEKQLAVKKKYRLPEKYIFYPAQFWKHKNHLNLLYALVFLKKKYKKKIDLVLTGSRQNNFDGIMKKVKDFQLQDQVHYLGFLPAEDMPYVYRLAQCLVMPSLFESVSLPVWEAFYLGIPVLSSDVCAQSEQVGNAGLLFDPLDPAAFGEKIHQLLSDKSLQKKLVTRGYQRVKNLTQKNYAVKLNKMIKNILSSSI